MKEIFPTLRNVRQKGTHCWTRLRLLAVNLLTSFSYLVWNCSCWFLDLFRLVCRMNNVCWFVGIGVGFSHKITVFTLFWKTLFTLEMNWKSLSKVSYSRSYRKIVSFQYPESKIISDVSDVFWVASAVIVRVGSHHISISVSLFRFGRLGVAVAVDNVTELILGMVLRGDSTLNNCDK